MSDEALVITRQEWQSLQEKLNRIEAAITGGLDGASGGLRGRMEGLEREVSVVRAQVAALEESRRWVVRLVSGAVLTTVVSAIIAAIQMTGKH